MIMFRPDSTEGYVDMWMVTEILCVPTCTVGHHSQLLCLLSNLACAQCIGKLPYSLRQVIPVLAIAMT